MVKRNANKMASMDARGVHVRRVVPGSRVCSPAYAGAKGRREKREEGHDCESDCESCDTSVQ